MELDFTAEQDALRATVRSMLVRECPIAFVRAIVERGESADALWGRMVELDWPALTVAERLGGIGLGFIDLAVVVEELGRVIAPGPFLSTVTQFAPAIREAGADGQGDAWLSAIAAGEVTGTLALAEDDLRWAFTGVATEIARNGDGWRLTGCKRFVVDAARADELLVVARLTGTTGDHGVTAVLVPAAEADIRPLDVIDASRPAAEVRLDGVRVSDDRVLGPPGEGAAPLRRALEEATIALALEMVGTCQTIFDVALGYAKVREQFGVPIGSFQAVKHKLTDLFVAIERARATCYFAAATIEEDDPRRSLAASMAKAAAGDCQRLVAQDGIQLLGGIGYTWEHDMQLYVKRAKGGDGLFGTAAAHRQVVAAAIGL